MMLRPMRPNPLMPTFTAIAVSSVTADAPSLMNALATVKPPDILQFYDQTLHDTPSCMYLLYSLLTLVVFVVVSPYFAVSGDPLQEVHRQPRPAPRLPADLVQPRRRGIDLDSRRVGRRGADRAGARRRSARRRYPRLRLFLSTTTMAGQQVARRSLQHVDAVFYFPFDWAFIVRRTLQLVKPRLFVMMETEIWPNLLRECRRARRQDGRDQRPHLVALVSALPADPAVLPARARRRRSLLHAERGVGAAADRPRRRSRARHRDRQPEVRFARDARRRSSHGKPRERVLRFFRHLAEPRRSSSPAARCAAKRRRCCARSRASRRRRRSALLILAPRHPERFGEVERLAREAGFVDRAALRAADRRRAARRRRRARHASASWRSSISSRRRCSSAAASSTTAATTSSSRRSSASRSSSARTCRTSRRLPTRSSPTARPCRCSPSASSRRRC